MFESADDFLTAEEVTSLSGDLFVYSGLEAG